MQECSTLNFLKEMENWFFLLNICSKLYLMNVYVERLNERITPLREKIVNHEVYSAIDNIERVRIFMQHHVYAVWDFMSLLKSLQRELTCTSIPWFPKGNGNTRFLINEIVAGEESDVDESGNRKSHFELYLDAMQQCGAAVSGIRTFVEVLERTADFEAAFVSAKVKAAAKDFVQHTFHIINQGKTHVTSAVFTFGREDLIPSMFHSLVEDIEHDMPGSISIFRYYLERHIEVDGDHHSKLALQMTADLCGSDEKLWEEATDGVIASLEKRIALWDAVLEEINT